ncbi:hypothetical protein [Paenibacillus planticolens]|uniref:Toprim domain-containing protein n=1 Tax=Paenibacillus planticolens TaxID=2654976 RepID=A0ABX1ZLK9_9BACL|nr:hypothetical protein [Paenibacillus planticolens]NOU99504.1 hypothetical protein [Paenibacillus planticolens]
MRDSLSFLVIGDSESGKSSFIRTFCDEDTADLLNISGEGQTTRCDGFYNFTYKGNNANRITVSFYSKDEFTEKQCKKIVEKYNLKPKDPLDLNKVNDYIIKQSMELTPTERDSMWRIEKEDILRKISNKNLVDDEFINLTEFSLEENMGILITSENIETIQDYDQFLLLITKKLEDIYEEIKRKTTLFIELFQLPLNSLTENNPKIDIPQLRFNLDENTKLLLTYCIKKATMRESLEDTDMNSLSGIVKSVAVELKLNEDYAKICSSVGIKQIKLVDTYGLDHAGDTKGDITVKSIKKRLTDILDGEFRDIDSVIFITPMHGKAASTNERFNALIEAKRSIIPQIVYTKYDLYAQKQFGSKIYELNNEKLEKVKDNFMRNNSNKIKDDFYDILKEHYSKDVAEYRKECIFNNISYFMGTFEIDDKLDRKTARINNISYFKNILVSVLQNDNYGVAIDNIDKGELKQQLTQGFMLNKNGIQEKLGIMIRKAQETLNKNYSISHGRTRGAFWRRLDSNMFGFYGDLNLRNVLITSYIEVLAKDSGEHREDNLGNLIVNDYFKDKKLNVFLRECINKFGHYYFCAGCLPCEALMPNKCDMSKSCNTTGTYERVKRNNSCFQFNEGIYTGSRKQSKYCTNNGMHGIGLVNEKYGKESQCWGSCYWMLFFKKFEDTKTVELNCGEVFSDFVDIFIEFCVKQYTNSVQSVKNLNYLKHNNDTVLYDTNEEDEFTKKFEEVTASQKDFIVLTEGETDKIHIQAAWKKLMKTELPFDVYAVNGADNIKQFLTSYPTDMLPDKKIISILDHDEKGIRVAKDFKKSMKDIDGSYVRVHQSDKDKNRQYYIILLPHVNKKFEEYENGEIEFLYSRELLEEYNIIRKRSIGKINSLDYVKNSEKYISGADYDNLNDLFYFEIINENSSKTKFARSIEKREELGEEVFSGFKLLFDAINNITNHVVI